ncbi:HAMP domain-containing protein [Aquabacterium soli]|uniref:histidine kinase n=1 Tax=Aquabacterium soli TaxID=2493092 RepID=A0A3R8T2V4_9BURK|nr:ATP-binding protein [Aquabacterium soli]RRS02717.1 HAMP domain-containing protein [Aquabacterium soli]
MSAAVEEDLPDARAQARRGWWPRTLGWRIALILLGGLVLAYALSLASIMRERQGLADTMMHAYVARDLASSVGVLDRLPAAERAAWLEPLSRPNYRLALRDEAAVVPPGTEPTAMAQALALELRQRLGDGRVQGLVPEGDRGAVIRMRLADGTPLTVHLAAPMRGVSAANAALLLAQLLVLGACVAWAVRLATRPLVQLAQAADRLGADPQADVLPPFDATGPAEVRRAHAAFQSMQTRIREHMAERLQLLAAISHDLQTPITRLRLRTEALIDESLREKFQADLLGMQRLVEEGLAYARSVHASAEPACRVDLHALLDGLVCDYADAGRPVMLQAPSTLVLTTRPLALQRIVGNLVDNALKFAGAAELSAQAVATQGAAVVQIVVRDRGPGVPVGQLARITEPFVRLEASRNADTGGSGLGLAIAQRLAQALGGRLSLRNRDGGGLEALLTLPQPGPGDVPGR